MKYQFDPYVVEYEKVRAPLHDFRTECILAAHKAASMNENNLPIIVMMSGGLDSELIAESLYLANIPFKAVIGKLQIEVATEIITLNKHDYGYAERWCNAHDIEVEYCSVDIYKQTKLLTEYVLSAQGFSPQYAWHMYLMKWCSDHGYFFMTAFGDINISLVNNKYVSVDKQINSCIDIFCKNNGLNGITRFVKLDSQMTASFLKLTSVQKLMAEKTIKLLDHKYTCFSEAFPEMSIRPKHTGFESIQEWDNILRTYMKRHNGQYNKLSFTPISQFMEQE